MQNSEPCAPFWLDKTPVMFPSTHLAMRDPNGLLAIGGDLTPDWLLNAYSKGIFPWFSADDPILWWTPSPRSVLLIDQLKFRKSLRKNIQKYRQTQQLNVTLDQNFASVMQKCATIKRHDQGGTWITNPMLNAYKTLHKEGHAHSVEVWLNHKLVGGLYGIALGKMFFGESMFSEVTDGSKIALIALAMQLKTWGFKLIDTQVETPHLKSMGATIMSRDDFETQLHLQSKQTFPAQKWCLDMDWFQAAIEHAYNQKNKENKTNKTELNTGYQDPTHD